MRRALLFLLLLLGCVTNPRTGRSQLLLRSESDMNNLGKAAYAEMTGPESKTALSKNSAAIAALQRVGHAIAAAADKPDYEWEFRLIQDNKTVNAWALPGGKIAFYTGIFPVLKDEAGMAIVMGHEVMHAILQHGNERMSQGLLANIGIAAAALSLHDNENRDEIVSALGVGANVAIMLPFSRSHESEADHYGLLLAARAGYDPEAAIGVWTRMDELSKGKSPPEFLSTHPATKRRIEQMKKWMPAAKQLYAQSVKHPNRPLPKIR